MRDSNTAQGVRAWPELHLHRAGPHPHPGGGGEHRGGGPHLAGQLRVRVRGEGGGLPHRVQEPAGGRQLQQPPGVWLLLTQERLPVRPGGPGEHHLQDQDDRLAQPESSDQVLQHQHEGKVVQDCAGQFPGSVPL